MALTLLGDLIGGLVINGINAAIQNSEAEEARDWQAQENAKNREWAAEQASLDRKENFAYGERSANNADERSRALYEQLQSPSAMLSQYKAAGLSPSMMFGGSGAGGQSVPNGAQGNGAQGITTPYSYTNSSPLEAEQIALMKAQERKINAEALTEEGLTTKGIAQIENLIAEAKNKLADAGYKKASEDLQRATTGYTTVKTRIENAKGEAEINKAYAEAEKAATEAQTAIYSCVEAYANAHVSEATMKEKIEQVKSQVQNIKVDTLLKSSMRNLNEAQVQKISAEVAKWQEEVKQGWQDLSIKLMNAETEQEKNRIMEEYQDAQIDNLMERLQFDKDAFKQQNIREWLKFGHQVWNDQKEGLAEALGIVAKFLL